MSAAFDPRLAKAVAGVRAMLWWLGVFGLLMLLCAVGIGAAVVEGTNKANFIPGLVFSGGFLVGGLMMLRAVIRGPAHNKAIRLMTTDRANLRGYDLIYVSVNNGPTKPRVVLYPNDGRSVELYLERGQENEVLAYLAEISVRIPSGAA